jgi:Ca2+-dependent lipid-binding protein
MKKPSRSGRETIIYSPPKILFIMRDLISLVIVVLIVGWLVGYIGFGAAIGNLIHILLVLAVIGILYRLATGRRI